MSTRERKTKKKPPRLDPILPLPAGTGIDRALRQGEGASILRNDQPIGGVGLTYRAFWVLWEQAELRAAQNYPRHVGGTMDHAAQAWLEVVVWFRKVANPEIEMRIWPEAKAQKARAWWAEEDKRIAAAKKKAKKDGEPEADEKPKKKRCKAEKKGVRCRGPLGHGGKHKGVTAKGKKVSWE